MRNFALIGAAGYIAPQHLQAIRATGNNLIAAADPSDSVGVLDQFFPEARFFTEIERFDRFLEKLRRRSDDERVHYLSICSPNYLHDAHVRLALRLQANAICEKPLVINPWNLDALADLEQEFSKRVYCVLQLRLLSSLATLRETVKSETPRGKADVCLTYITPRGPWYHTSWKGQENRSGGVATNIGVHFFDLLNWIFGPVESQEVHLSTPSKMSGCIEFAGARARWFLSIDRADLPAERRSEHNTAFRSLLLDGKEIEFSTGFTDLHTKVYEDILAGGGFGIEDARPAIELVHKIRTSPIVSPRDNAHPLCG
jgi:UDP-N-acetyl-2-amino-2-deoxyglucuronate dehydrogenase